MISKLSIILVLSCLSISAYGISLRDRFHENLVKKSIDEASPSMFEYKHIADVGGDKILPRSYVYGNDLFFDENGAAFPLNPTRFTLGDLLQGSNVAGNQRVAPTFW